MLKSRIRTLSVLQAFRHSHLISRWLDRPVIRSIVTQTAITLTGNRREERQYRQPEREVISENLNAKTPARYFQCTHTASQAAKKDHKKAESSLECDHQPKNWKLKRRSSHPFTQEILQYALSLSGWYIRHVGCAIRYWKNQRASSESLLDLRIFTREWTRSRI